MRYSTVTLSWNVSLSNTGTVPKMVIILGTAKYWLYRRWAYMSAKGSLRTRRYKRYSFFDVVSGMMIGVFVTVRILQRVQSKIWLVKRYRNFFPNIRFFWPCISIHLNRDSQLKSTKRTSCCIYTCIPPENGLKIYTKPVEVDWRNKLRINSASSWFLLHRSVSLAFRYIIESC
jgi:hypothetical protein